MQTHTHTHTQTNEIGKDGTQCIENEDKSEANEDSKYQICSNITYTLCNKELNKKKI